MDQGASSSSRPSTPPASVAPRTRAKSAPAATNAPAPDDATGATTAELAALEDAKAARATAEAALRDAELARAEAEAARAQLQAVLDVLPVGVGIADAQGAAVHLNPAYRALWGRNIPLPQGIEEFRTFRGWWPTTGKPIAAEEWATARALLTGEVVRDEEVEIEAFDGQRKIVLTHAAPIRDATGAIIGAVVAQQDISARKRLESERAQALAEAEVARQRLRDLFLQAPAFICVTRGPEHRVELINDNFRALNGWREFLGKTAREGWPELEGQGFFELLDQVYATGEPFVAHEIPAQIDRNNDGVLSEGFITLVYQPARDAQGHVEGILVFATEVTEQARAREALAASETAAQARARELEAVFEAAADGMVIYDTQGGLVKWNAALAALFEFERDPDYTALPVSIRPARIAIRDGASGLPIPADQLPFMRAVRGEILTGAHAVDLSATLPSGREAEVSASAAPLRGADGAIIGAVTVYRDVTQRRALERQTHDALDALLAMAEALVSANGIVPSVSGSRIVAFAGVAESVPEDNQQSAPFAATPVPQRIAQLTRSLLKCSSVSITALEGNDLLIRPVAIAGLTPEQETQWWDEQEAAIGYPLSAGMQPTDLQRLLNGETVTFDLTRPPYEHPNAYGVTAVLAAPMLIQERLMGLLALDFHNIGEDVHVFTVEEIRLATAIARLGAVALERDRLLRERAAAEAQVMAEQATNAQMNQFVGIAGHELRTPITSVQAAVQLAERAVRASLVTDLPRGADAKLGRAQGLLERADQQLVRLNRLVEDLLDVTRIASGKLELRREPDDLGDVARDVVETQRLAWPGRDITLEIAEGTPVQLAFDADRIGQVVTNYLTNALKYSAEDRPVQVVIAADNSTPEAQRVRVSVRDQGPGLAPDALESLWEPFHQAKGIRQQSGSSVGLGLGLHICKTIVERHGGSVGIESVPGEGSTFWFTLPIEQR